MRWLHVLLVVSIASMPLVAAEPVEDLTGGPVLDYLSHLLREGGMGRLSRERAAFLASDDAGYVCLMWPKTGGFNSETFRGTRPPGVVAVVHTHPLGNSLPSANDQRQAIRLGIPVVVLTPRNIAVAMPDGSHRFVVRNQRWYTPGTENRCRNLPAE